MKAQKLSVWLPTIGAMVLLNIGSYGQSAEAIIDKLVDKGILTVEEANELRQEADKNVTSSSQPKTGVPDWVKNFKITGDLRGRYETFHADDQDPGFVDRHRFRYRLRIGALATLKDNFDVGFRLMSGESRGNYGGDPISGNTTWSDNASKKFIYIDQAFARWRALNTPSWSGSLTVGKMENPFVFSDMVFDSDYTPEGFAQQFAYSINDEHSLRFILGQFVLDELSTQSDDPFMFGAQVRFDSKWNAKWATSFGLGALTITSDENLVTPTTTARVTDTSGTTRTVEIAGNDSVPNVNSGNRRVGNRLMNGFNPVIVDGAVIYTLESFPMYRAAFPIRISAEYMNNPAADDQNEGYAFGITFGKSGKKGLWDLTYRWKHLQADAWWEEVVDSDFGGLSPAGVPTTGTRAAYRSGTNVEGHIIRATYSLYDSVTLSATYLLGRLIAGLPEGFDEDVGRLQLDAIWKF